MTSSELQFAVIKDELCTIFQKGYASMNFSSTCLWNPNQDGSVTVKYENDKMHAFVCLFGLAP